MVVIVADEVPFDEVSHTHHHPIFELTRYPRHMVATPCHTLLYLKTFIYGFMVYVYMVYMDIWYMCINIAYMVVVVVLLFYVHG